MELFNAESFMVILKNSPMAAVFIWLFWIERKDKNAWVEKYHASMEIRVTELKQTTEAMTTVNKTMDKVLETCGTAGG